MKILFQCKNIYDFIRVWEHKALSDILKELGVKNAPKMSDEYDDIWVY